MNLYNEAIYIDLTLTSQEELESSKYYHIHENGSQVEYVSPIKTEAGTGTGNSIFPIVNRSQNNVSARVNDVLSEVEGVIDSIDAETVRVKL